MKCTFQVIAAAALFVIPWGARAQDKPVVQPADYGQWESLGAPTLSSDGGWLVYLVRRVNEENELRIRNLGRDSTRVVAYGTAPSFANDSRWLAYSVGVSPDERERLTAQEEPVRNKLEILNLTSGEELVIEDIASFSFSEDGAYLAARGYPPEGGPRGVADLLVRDLQGGTTSNFGNVSSFAWSDIGSVLAMTINTETGTGNGLHVYDPASASLRVLESSTATYRGLAWREDEDDLAVLRSVEDEDFDEDTNVILVWMDIGSSRQAKRVFDPSEAGGFPEATRIAEQRNLEWADDGSALYFGLRPREKSPEEESEEESAEADTTDAAPDTQEEKQSDVQIWRAVDYRIMPMQRAQEQRDLQRTMLAVWHIDSDRFVQVGTDLMEISRAGISGCTISKGMSIGNSRRTCPPYLPMSSTTTRSNSTPRGGLRDGRQGTAPCSCTTSTTSGPWSRTAPTPGASRTAPTSR